MRSRGAASALSTRQEGRYLRMLLINGARSVLSQTQRFKPNDPDRLRRWALHVQALRGHNPAAVALANKLARIVWAVWRNDSLYEARTLTKVNT